MDRKTAMALRHKEERNPQKTAGATVKSLATALVTVRAEQPEKRAGSTRPSSGRY